MDCYGFSGCTGTRTHAHTHTRHTQVTAHTAHEPLEQVDAAHALGGRVLLAQKRALRHRAQRRGLVRPAGVVDDQGPRRLLDLHVHLDGSHARARARTHMQVKVLLHRNAREQLKRFGRLARDVLPV